MKTSYGLDLAGYSTGKSALAKATFHETVGLSVVIYESHPFSKKLKGARAIGALAERERHLLYSLRPLYIDVPIDIRVLTDPTGAKFVWQLTKRPVDVAFSALPPLADRLGAPVARLKYLLAGDMSLLDSGLFETYPAASLIPMLGTKPSYKGNRAVKKDGRWVGDGGLANMLHQLRVEADDGTRLNDDQFDAAVCALTGVLPDDCLIRGADLDVEIRGRIEGRLGIKAGSDFDTTAPAGYVLICKPIPHSPISLRFEKQYPPESEGGR